MKSIARTLSFLKKSKLLFLKPLLLVFSLAFIFSLILHFQNLNFGKEDLLNREINKLNSELTREKLASEILGQELLNFQESTPEVKLQAIEIAIDQYNAALEKEDLYSGQGVDTSGVEAELSASLALLTSKEYAKASEKLNSVNTELDKLLAEKTAADQKKAIETQPQASGPEPGIGSGRITVQTARGNFLIDLLKLDLNGTRVITDSASDHDCSDNCPTKPLAQYVSENGGFAGINGTYFCPADYASCAGKLNSFDFGFYNTRQGHWLNATTLFWNSRAMLAFDGSANPYFFREANTFGVSDLKAAIVNYPALVENGSNVLGDGGSLGDYLKVSKSTRSGIGIKGKIVYLVVARGASVPDLAEIFISLGVDQAMNLDGGGSSALYYNGRYLAGPGRSLPNAVIFAR